MNTRKKLIIGNWKMYKNVSNASLLLNRLEKVVAVYRDVDVVLCPTMLTLQSLSLQVNRRQFKLGAQNCYWRDEGAFTGEVSAAQLSGVVDYVLIGHSERRHIFGESEKDIRAKVQAAIRNRLRPVICVGETAAQRVDGETRAVIQDQVVSALANITSDEIDTISIAYEPVWAIGTGENAQPADAEKVAQIIHKQVTTLYGEQAADAIRILYGGSVNDQNAASYMTGSRIDGLLVGGASLTPQIFAKIVDEAHNNHNDKKV